MNNVAIRGEGLSKRYAIGELQQYKTLRDTITDAFYASLYGMTSILRGRRFAGDGRLSNSFHWALKDVSFEIKQGEVVGVIGRNGVGKSTLLKILSRITEPTGGFAEIHGRVGSLLEVGTGFHPELTGRENVFLNGAILGMKRAEIIRKFDEIVSFAEVERYVDTPVKHYSSGMYLRLAFGVAAHLETEILLVDEVLAVGDARFRKKCLNKMEDIGQQGRTVLFVSHNMQSVTRLCRRTILLDEGRVLQDGPSSQVVSAYLNSGFGTTAVREWPDPSKAPAGEVARLRAVRVRTKDGRITDSVDIHKLVGIEMEYDVIQSGHMLLPHFHIYNEQGVHAFSAHDLDPAWRRRPRPIGRWVSTGWIPGNFLSEGTFFVSAEAITLDPPVTQFYERDAVAFQVLDSEDGDSARGDWTGTMGGVVRPLLKWNTHFTPNGREATELVVEETNVSESNDDQP